MKNNYLILFFYIFLTNNIYSQNKYQFQQKILYPIVTNQSFKYINLKYNLIDTNLIFKFSKKSKAEIFIENILNNKNLKPYSMIKQNRTFFILKKDSIIYFSINYINKLDTQTIYYFNINECDLNFITKNFNIEQELRYITNSELKLVIEFINKNHRNLVYYEHYKIKDHQLFVDVKISNTNFWGRTIKTFKYVYNENNYELINK